VAGILLLRQEAANRTEVPLRFLKERVDQILLSRPKEAAALSCHVKLAPTYDAFWFETRFNWLRVFDGYLESNVAEQRRRRLSGRIGKRRHQGLGNGKKCQ
jgi:hypothetical protein